MMAGWLSCLLFLTLSGSISEQEPLTFGWPEFARAKVTETRTIGEDRYVREFSLLVSPRSGGRRVIRISSSRFLENTMVNDAWLKVFNNSELTFDHRGSMFRVLSSGELDLSLNLSEITDRIPVSHLDWHKSTKLESSSLRTVVLEFLPVEWNHWIEPWLGYAGDEGARRVQRGLQEGGEYEEVQTLFSEGEDPERKEHIVLRAKKVRRVEQAAFEKNVDCRVSLHPNTMLLQWVAIESETKIDGTVDSSQTMTARYDFEWSVSAEVETSIRSIEAELIVEFAEGLVRRVPERAIELCAESRALLPSRDAHLVAAAAHRELDQLDRAWAECEQALALGPSPETVVERGKIRLERGEYSAIIEELRASSLGLRLDSAHDLLAKALIATGRAGEVEGLKCTSYWQGVARALCGRPWAAAEDLLKRDDVYRRLLVSALTGESMIHRGRVVEGWPAQLVAFQLDEIEADTLLALANEAAEERTRREQLCEAHFSIGMKKHHQAGFESARPHFELCVEQKVFTFTETIWALGLLALDGIPAVTAPVDPEPTGDGYIDRTGAWVVPPVFSRAHDHTKFGSVIRVGEMSGVLLPSGTVRLFPKIWLSGAVGSQGWLIAASKTLLGERSGYLNFSGEWEIPPRFHWAIAFSEESEFAQVGSPVGAFGRDARDDWIDRSGHSVFPFEFASCFGFVEGLAFAELSDGRRVFFDVNGKIAFELKSKRVVDYSKSDILFSDETTDLCGFLDRTGEVTIPASFEDAHLFRGDVAPAMREERWGLIDRTGKWVLEPQFESISFVGEERFRYKLDGMSGLLLADGSTLTEPRFDRLHPFSEGLAVAKLNGRYGYIDRQGSWVIAPQFKSAGAFSEGRAVVTGFMPGGPISVPAEWFENPEHARKYLDQKMRDAEWADFDRQLSEDWIRARLTIPVDPKVLIEPSAEDLIPVIEAIVADASSMESREFTQAWVDWADLEEVVWKIDESATEFLIDDRDRTEQWLASETERLVRAGAEEPDFEAMLAHAALTFDEELRERAIPLVTAVISRKIGSAEKVKERGELLCEHLRSGVAKIELAKAGGMPQVRIRAPRHKVSLAWRGGRWWLQDWNSK